MAVDIPRLVALECEIASLTTPAAGALRWLIEQVGEADREGFDRGRDAGLYQAELEAKYGTFCAHLQNVITAARAVSNAATPQARALALPALYDHLQAYDTYLAAQRRGY